MGVHMVKKNDKINYNEKWSFKSKNIAKNFDIHVRQSVPLYDEIQRMVVELSNYFLRDNDKVMDLGGSTATTIENIIKNTKKKNIKFVLIDESQEMLDEAKLKLKKYDHNFEFVNSNLNYEFNPDDKYSVVILLFTMQFINVENRQELLRKIYHCLRKKGCLIMVEKIIGNSAVYNEMMIDLYNDMKIRNGLDPRNNIIKSRSLRGIMVPMSLDENLIMLRNIGFVDNDIFFKWYNFAGFISIK